VEEVTVSLPYLKVVQNLKLAYLMMAYQMVAEVEGFSVLHQRIQN
jgi:hypothetical protein